MSLNPRLTHAMEQMGGVVRELASVLGQYRNELKNQGVPPDEAWALTQRFEERLAARLFKAYETADDS